MSVSALPLLLITGFPPHSMWLFAAVSTTLEAVYFTLLSNAYSDHDFSLVYPIARGTVPALLMLWSILFLHEKLSVGGIVGIGMIVYGMIISATSLVQNRGSKLQWTAHPSDSRGDPGGIAYLLALSAYAVAPLSYSGAIREVSVVIGAFLGWQFLQEEIGALRVLGSIVIFVGILLTALLG